MIVLDHPTAAAPLDVTSLIKRQKLSASDRTALRSTCERIARSLDLIESNRPSKTNFYSRLQAAADAAEREAMDDPTPENVERLHVAVVRASQATTTFDRINVALNAAIRREIDSLTPLANRLLDATATALETEGKKRLAEITQADATFGEAGDSTEFQRRLDSTRVSLSDERSAVNQGGAALDWLCRHGFTENPFRDPAAFLGTDAEPLDLDRELQADLH
jgi:hypothetical protein